MATGRLPVTTPVDRSAHFSGETEMLDSEGKKVVFGLLILLAIVGNVGVVEAVAAAQEVSIPGWASVVGAILVLIPELLLLSALTAQTGWNLGCVGQNLTILWFLALTVYATVRFAYTGKVILSWFQLEVAIGWLLLVPGFLGWVLYLACAVSLHDEEGS